MPVRLLLGVLALWLAWFALAQARIAGVNFLLSAFALVWAADIGAFFAGRRFGRRKLAPEVSPNKTWEGALGGALAGLAVAAAGAVWLDSPALPLLGVGLVVVFASMVGDLTESMFKRFAGLKDSGRLLPGHGGILDRIDSITAAGPFFVLGLAACGLLR